MKKLLFILAIILFASPVLASDIYWVAVNGAATWGNCESDTELSGTAACSMNTANSNCDPSGSSGGIIINIRAGTYNTAIHPTYSGTATKKINYKAYNSESVIITDTALLSGYQFAIWINYRDYIVIDGITTQDPLYRSFLISNYSDCNEIKNCTFTGASAVLYGSATENFSTNNWIHDNLFYDSYYIHPDTDPIRPCQESGGFSIGSPSSGYTNSNNNTVENNEFYGLGHHGIETYTNYNVIRNNWFHNNGYVEQDSTTEDCNTPDSNDKYGDRNILIDGHTSDTSDVTRKRNLIEGNRSSDAGRPPDDDGAYNISLASPRNIVRYNEFFNAAHTGVYFKVGGRTEGSYNYVYNNTIYYNGVNESDGYNHPYGLTVTGSTVRYTTGNIIKNNLIYGNSAGDYLSYGGTSSLSYHTWENNYLNADGDPNFTDSTVPATPSESQPDLVLLGGSGAIDNGSYLTQANGAGSSSTSLTVDDAGYFQAGSSAATYPMGSALSSIAADYIIISSSSTDASGGTEVQISDIDYETNIITLASAQTWSDDDYIFLSKDSDGSDVLINTLPDQGAHEVSAAGGISGTIIADSMSESDVVSGGSTIVINLLNDTFVADISAYRAELIASFTSAQSETHGWNNEILADEVVTAVVRTDDNTITWTLTANGDYSITASEIIGASAYMPNEILTNSEVDIQLSPSFLISNENPSALTPVIGVSVGENRAGSYSATGQAILVPN